jgi:SAM-dependent methyltransferase
MSATGNVMTASSENYDRFASIYNTYFGAYSKRVLPVLERLVLASLPRSAHILDVCSGTGHLAAALLARGFAVSGIDGSAEMLRIAQENAPSAEFICADVRTFRQPERYDAAVSTHDSINHILETAELRLTFENVYQALRPGGRFVFDMNMEEGYLCRWGGGLHGSDQGCPFIIRAHYSSTDRLARNVVTWLEAVGRASREITFTERCYSEQEVRSALTIAGFQEIDVHDGERDLGLAGEIGRAFFVCKKIVSRQRFRSVADCIADALWPGASAVDQEAWSMSRRLRALEEVVATLPPEPYERFKQQANQFEWFLPAGAVLGQVHPFRATFEGPAATDGQARWARVVYLSPLLEEQEWPVIVTVVAHELAHLILGHGLQLDREAYELQEEAARGAVMEWGFQEEADRASEVLRDQATNQRYPESQRGIRPAGLKTMG